PGEKLDIKITCNTDTTQGKTVNAGILSLLAGSDAYIPPIPFSRRIFYPRQISLMPRNDTVSHSTSVMKLYVRNSDLTGIHSIDFDLDYNNDLLEFRNAVSANV